MHNKHNHGSVGHMMKCHRLYSALSLNLVDKMHFGTSDRSIVHHKVVVK